MQKNTKKQTESPKLFRSENNKMLAGVCGGLSQYFSVDATLIRCAFVLLSLFGGAGPLIYLILWIVVPSETSTVTNPNDVMRENAKEMKEKAKIFQEEFAKQSGPDNSRFIVGVTILGFGLLFLLKNLGFLRFFDISRLWPLILVAVGLAVLTKKN